MEEISKRRIKNGDLIIVNSNSSHVIGHKYDAEYDFSASDASEAYKFNLVEIPNGSIGYVADYTAENVYEVLGNVDFELATLICCFPKLKVIAYVATKHLAKLNPKIWPTNP